MGVTHTTTVFPPDAAVAGGGAAGGQGKAEAAAGHEVALPPEMAVAQADRQRVEAYAPMHGGSTMRCLLLRVKPLPKCIDKAA